MVQENEKYSNKNSSSLNSYYGSIAIINEEQREEFFIPITPLEEGLKNDSPTFATFESSTVSSTDIDSFVHQKHRTIMSTFFNYFFLLLGFSRNPLESASGMRNSAASDMRLAMLSNFSTAYNIVSISLALNIMGHIYPASPRDNSICSSALIGGMIVGQLIGGAIGDILGRHLAMAVVMGLQVVGALVSALSFDGYFSIYIFLACKLNLVFIFYWVLCHRVSNSESLLSFYQPGDLSWDWGAAVYIRWQRR